MDIEESIAAEAAAGNTKMMTTKADVTHGAIPNHKSNFRLWKSNTFPNRKSRSIENISLSSLNLDSHDSPEKPLEASQKWPLKSSSPSLADFLGNEIYEDGVQQEIAQKTQTYMVGRQEAETEVVIDRLIQKEGSKDKALLYVISQMVTELKVQIVVNTLLHRGANPSFSDSNWQTPLHHAVKRGFKGVVSKLLEHDALPQVRDRDKKMPLHFAIEGRHDEIASMLLQYMPNNVVRDLFITYDKDTAECTLHYLLKEKMQQTALAVLDCMIDRIEQTGHMKVFYHILEADENGRPPTHSKFEPQSRSCLHLISKEGHKDIIYHLVVRLLIRKKWKEFARFRFQLNSFLFIFTLLCITFSMIVAVTTPDPVLYDTPLQIARAVFEVWSLMATIVTLFIELNQFRKHKLEYWKDQFNWIDLGSASLLISVVPLRFAHCQEQWHVFAVGYLLWTLRIFKYAAVFRQTGAYAQILWRLVSHDFLQFTVFFLVILLAFSGSFVLALRGEESLDIHSETSSFWQVLFTGVRILIEGQPVVEYTGSQGYKTMSCIIMVVFLFFCCVVLLNILIAQLSDTYQNVQKDAQRGLEMNRAWIITRVELNSLFIGKGYRVSKYREMEEFNSTNNVLEKWESPLLNEIGKDVRDIKEYLTSTELNMLTITNRLSRQEYTLKQIQEQLDMMMRRQAIPEEIKFIAENQS